MSDPSNLRTLLRQQVGNDIFISLPDGSSRNGYTVLAVHIDCLEVLTPLNDGGKTRSRMVVPFASLQTVILPQRVAATP